MVDECADDENTAEKAQHGARSRIHNSVPSEGQGFGKPENSVPVEYGSHDQDGLDFRHDAKVWHLYLVEAEREAKERAELWRTGLDAVLIFAGLFAGIVSAFVIDIRKDLEADSEQRLLANIDSMLQSHQPSTKGIPAISIAMSGLWNISLYITLFAAMMGASAKAWLATFVPVNTPHEAKGAFHRYRLDQHAERWCLREVIAAAPLLVQLALFLFLIGLVLQNFADNWVLGSILLLFCVLGAILYLLMTIHPWTTPSSPYNTAASDPLLWIALGLPSRGKKNPPDVEEDINKGLAGILYGHLLKSPKPNLVDEAIAEIALPEFKQQWVDYMCRKDAARVALTRLRQCVTTRPTASDRDDNRICNILLVLLRFLEHYEVETQSPRYSRGENPSVVYKDLIDVLVQFSALEEHTHSISTLRDATEEVQLLFLTVRIHLGCRNSSPKALTSNAMPRFLGLPLCIGQGESNMDFSHLKLAACRAIIQEHPRYMFPSARLLCASLASVATNAQQGNAGQTTTTFASGKDMRELYFSVALRCLSKLYTVVSSEWDQNARLCHNQTRSGFRRRGASVMMTPTGNSPEGLSEEVIENVLAIIQEDIDFKATLRELVQGRSSAENCLEDALLSVVQSLCSTIQDTCPEDHGALIHLLAFLRSNYCSLFEAAEVLAALKTILPAILDNIAQCADDAEPRVQSLILDLLSTMAIVPESRKQIILHILGVSNNPQFPELEVNADMLIQLLHDERLADDPTDIVMIMFASHMLGSLQRASHQARILDALRLRCGSKNLVLDTVKHRELLEWFIMAVVGLHATPDELSRWVSRCQLWFEEVWIPGRGAAVLKHGQ